MPRDRRLFALGAVVTVALGVACAPEEDAADEAFRALQGEKQQLEQKRAELADVLAKAAAGDPQGQAAALEKEVAGLATAFLDDLVRWINESGIVQGQALTPEQKQAFRWKSSEDMLIAQEHIDKGGDYQRALDIYRQALALDPDFEELRAAIARAEEMRYPTEERFGQLQKRMTMDEVEAILGPVYLLDVQRYDDRGVTAWFYRKPAGAGAAGVYFQESKPGNGDWRVYNTAWTVPQGGGA